MSYDVSIGDATHNYTSNMWKLFRVAIPDGGIHELHDKTGGEAMILLINGLKNIATESLKFNTYEEFAVAYEPNNNWGSVGGAIDFLTAILKDCIADTTAVIEVSA